MSLSKKIYFLAVICTFAGLTKGIRAQTMLDGFMKASGEGTVVLNYSYESYDRFKFAKTTRGAPLSLGAKIDTKAAGLFAAYGLPKNLNVVVSIPYVIIQGNGDELEREQEVRGFQDATVYLKWKPIETRVGQGDFSAMAALGSSFPLSDYGADDILSLGNQATTAEFRAIAQYKFDFGFFANAQVGYSIRSNNVPDATILSGKVGYAVSKFYLDACVKIQISDSDAPDIMRPLIPFYENRVNFALLGINGYYPISSQLGLVAGFSHMLGGRNAVLPTGYSGGIVFNFGQ